MSQQLTKTILIGQILDFCWLVRVSLFIDLGQGEGGERGGTEIKPRAVTDGQRQIERFSSHVISTLSEPTWFCGSWADGNLCIVKYWPTASRTAMWMVILPAEPQYQTKLQQQNYSCNEQLLGPLSTHLGKPKLYSHSFLLNGTLLQVFIKRTNVTLLPTLYCHVSEVSWYVVT